MNWRNAAAGVLLLVGMMQMSGEILHNRTLKGLGAASAVAPSPKVFCDIDGFEPFAARFSVSTDKTSVPITPELYSRFKGPYNRRNVYGAAIAAAPRLPAPIRETVLNYAFKRSGPLRQELALTDESEIRFVTLVAMTRGRPDVWVFPITQ